MSELTTAVGMRFLDDILPPAELNDITEFDIAAVIQKNHKKAERIHGIKPYAGAAAGGVSLVLTLIGLAKAVK